MDLSLILNYLNELSENNNREWYHAHKTDYREANAAFESFIQELIFKIGAFDGSVLQNDPKNLTFKLVRDTRFSHDKSPFKTYFSALISAHGRHTDRACWYLHMGADECGIYGGLWNPPGPMLRKVRQAVVDNVDEFRQILATPPLPELYPEWYGAQLKTVPKGFDRNHPDADLLRLKEYGRCHSLSRGFFDNPDWPGELAGIAMTLKPMIDFLNYSIDE